MHDCFSNIDIFHKSLYPPLPPWLVFIPHGTFLVSEELWKAATYTLPWSSHSALPLPMGSGSVTSLLGTLFALRWPLLKISWLDCPLRPGSDKTGFWVLGAEFQTWSRQSAARERFRGALLSVLCIFTHGNFPFLLLQVDFSLTLLGFFPLKLGMLGCEPSLT